MFVSLAVMSAIELLQKLKATKDLWLQNVGTEIFWPWYALIGVVLTVGVAWVTKLLLPPFRSPGAESETVEERGTVSTR
jgi:hypothetical protein